MCTREELKSLILELLRHIEQVALLSAKIQFDEEIKMSKSPEYLTCSDNTNNYVRNNAQNARFKQLARFHVAYMKYYVFASDPYAEIVVPLSSSSLALFITNIMSKMAPSPQPMPFNHTSKTIVEFLQVSGDATTCIRNRFHNIFFFVSQFVNAPLVNAFFIQYKSDLRSIMKEMNLQYDIDTLTKIRHETFRKNLDMQRRGVPMRIPLIQRTQRTVSSSQKTQIIQLAQTATTAASLQPTAPVHTLHQMQPMRLATFEQHSYVGQQATTTMETMCAATVADMQMQIPTVTSTMMPNPIPPNENVYQVYTTNGQPIIDPSMPVYLISSNEPITVEVTSSDDVIGFAVDNDHVSADYTIPFDFDTTLFHWLTIRYVHITCRH